MPLNRTVVVGTRGSRLALRQTALVIDSLRACHPDLQFELREVRTEGDRRPEASLAKIGGQGVFVKELEAALIRGDVDLAVHSLKDVPVELSPGLTLAAMPERNDPRDTLVSRGGATLATLPEGAHVGTGSQRRAIQLRAARADLEPVDIRGNVDTRIRKVDEGQVDAVVLAAAGLGRLGLLDRAAEILPLEVMLPAVGQGALGLEVRAGVHLPETRRLTALRSELSPSRVGADGLDDTEDVRLVLRDVRVGIARVARLECVAQAAAPLRQPLDQPDVSVLLVNEVRQVTRAAADDDLRGCGHSLVVPGLVRIRHAAIQQNVQRGHERVAVLGRIVVNLPRVGLGAEAPVVLAAEHPHALLAEEFDRLPERAVGGGRFPTATRPFEQHRLHAVLVQRAELPGLDGGGQRFQTGLSVRAVAEHQVLRRLRSERHVDGVQKPIVRRGRRCLGPLPAEQTEQRHRRAPLSPTARVARGARAVSRASPVSRILRAVEGPRPRLRGSSEHPT
ncbi:MAG: hydroxymethylbilane synthase [Chloroflexi bacterium]|nr:hydroxymethylbilane synthase [Chloroflexota bacterium]